MVTDESFQFFEPGCYCNEGVKCHLSSLGLCGSNDYLFARILFVLIMEICLLPKILDNFLGSEVLVSCSVFS